MNSVPTPSIASPIGVKSNSENGSSPRSPRSCAATMFGGVPTSVVVPPRIAPNASGMNRRDGSRPARPAIVATAGIITAVAAMLFMNADSPPATSIRTAIRRVSLFPTMRWTRPAIMSATPVSSRAAPTMNTESMVMTAGDENPVNASLGVRYPPKMRTSRPRNAVRSTGSFSVRNR
jgi:hypothetical protein